MIDVHFIDNNSDLTAIVEDLMETGEIAIDLEFDNNLHHYGFKLCLLQLATESDVYLVDPFKTDICLLNKVFHNEEIIKSVFSFVEDIRLLHSLGCKLKNVYDISIAAKLLNFEKISLADVVKQVLEVSMQKSEQMSNWCNRPLTDIQLEYAAGDVIYLHSLRQKLHQLTVEKGIKDWIDEENQALISGMKNSPGIENQIPTKYRRNMNEIEWHYYKSLWYFREEIAKEFNKPSHQIINNSMLVEIAQNIELLNRWNELKNIHRGLKSQYYLKKIKEFKIKLLKEIKEYNLSDKRPALPPLSREEFQQIKARKTRIEFIKENYLKPVQELIKRDYGEYALPFILSNRIMEEIAVDDMTNYRKYRTDLIKKYLKELGLKSSILKG